MVSIQRTRKGGIDIRTSYTDPYDVIDLIIDGAIKYIMSAKTEAYDKEQMLDNFRFQVTKQVQIAQDILKPHSSA